MHVFNVLGQARFRMSLLRGLLLLPVLGSARAQPLPPEQLFERISPSVWLVTTQDAAGKSVGLGSAVVVGPQTMVTNCHVLKGARSASVSWESKILPARLEHSDPERDLCQFRVPGLEAAAVPIAPDAGLRVGVRAYAIGNPRGLELTMSEGMVSGLRRRAGELEAVQTTAPISPGSSGGGLFDAEGRLIGITTWALRDSQNLNFAIPAKWIGEVPMRSQERLARRNTPAAVATPQTNSTGAPSVPATLPATAIAIAPATAAAANSIPPGLLTRPLRAGDTFEYRVTDRAVRNANTVVMRVDRADDERAVFNSGARVESQSGDVIQLAAAMLGELDRVTPPGGWMPNGAVPRGSRDIRVASPDGRFRYRFTASAGSPQALATSVGNVQAIRIDLQGWVDSSATIGPTPVSARYRATVWLATELRRVVRFEALARAAGNAGGAYFQIDEALELVRIGGAS